LRSHIACRDKTSIRAGAPPIAISLVSAGALAYEVLLIRLFSIIQWHHFAYMAISIALLGYGASGSFLAVFQDRLRSSFIAVFALHQGTLNANNSWSAPASAPAAANICMIAFRRFGGGWLLRG
jgi:hypothetical protein